MKENVLVTGANRGIGLELCRQLAARGDHVIAACRQSSASLDGLGVQVEAGVDVTSDASVCELARRLAGLRLAALVNNAGVLRGTSLEHLDFEACRFQFEVNSLGPLRVTRALLPNLAEGSKVIIVTSRMGSIADNGSGGSYGYRMSKAAVNMAGVSLARDLEPRGISVGILHPGWVKTDMTGHSGLCTAGESAAGLIARMDDLSLAETGGFWHMNGERLPW